MRQLCRALPQHEHRVVYLHDTAVKPLDLYRMLASELGLQPGPRASIVPNSRGPGHGPTGAGNRSSAPP